MPTQDSRTMELILNPRSSKIRIVGFLTVMLSCVYITHHLFFLFHLWNTYREALVKSLTINVDMSDLHNVNGSISVDFENYFEIPILVHSITIFFVFNEVLPIRPSSIPQPERRNFGSVYSELNKVISGERCSLTASGLINFSSMENIGYILQGMATINLKNDLVYYSFIDATVPFFGFKMRTIFPLAKPKPYVHAPVVILPRVYTPHNKIYQLNPSTLTKSEKLEKAKNAKVKEIKFSEDLSLKDIGSALFYAAGSSIPTVAAYKAIFKVLLAFKFYHLNFCFRNLHVEGYFYFEHEYIQYDDNSTLSKYKALNKFEPKYKNYALLKSVGVSTLKDTVADAYTGELFNNRMMTYVERPLDGISWDLAQMLWKWAWGEIKEKFSLAVRINRNKNRFTDNLDYTNLTIQKFGVMIFYMYPTTPDIIKTNDRFLKECEEENWEDL